MRAVAFANIVLVAGAVGDFCCYWPLPKDLNSCDDCTQKAYDTDGEADCLSSKDNTWCPSGVPSTTLTPNSPSPGGWKKATWTAYESWPRCCTGSPNYDPNAPTDECSHFSGCRWQGLFAYHQCSGTDGQCSLDWVQSHDLVAFFSTSGEHTQYQGKKIRIHARGKTIEAMVVDTCGDGDCGGCCSTNARQSGEGFLIDMEYHTVLRHWPDITEPAANLFATDITWQPVDSNTSTTPTMATSTTTTTTTTTITTTTPAAATTTTTATVGSVTTTTTTSSIVVVASTTSAPRTTTVATTTMGSCDENCVDTMGAAACRQADIFWNMCSGSSTWWSSRCQATCAQCSSSLPPCGQCDHKCTNTQPSSECERWDRSSAGALCAGDWGEWWKNQCKAACGACDNILPSCSSTVGRQFSSLSVSLPTMLTSSSDDSDAEVPPAQETDKQAGVAVILLGVVNGVLLLCLLASGYVIMTGRHTKGFAA